MITATTLPTFPTCPSYGFSSRPDYLVKIVAREGGYEKRDRKWSEPLHYYDGAPMGPRPQADIEAIAAFFHAMGGRHQTFRFLDYADYRSAFLDDDVTPLDMPLEVLGGGEYQLVKRYRDETLAFSTLRTIRNPIGSTIRIANNLGVEQASSAWTIDEDTGILTIEGSFSGTPASWGGHFYVPCRFDGDLRTVIQDKKIMNLEISIKETRPDE